MKEQESYKEVSNLLEKNEYLKKGKNGVLRVIFGRTGVVFLLLLLQLGILLSSFAHLSEYAFFVYGGFTILSAATVIYILNEQVDPSFQLVWVVPVLLFPVFGALMYLFVHLQIGTKFIAKRLSILREQTKPYLSQNKEVFRELKEKDAEMARLCTYMDTVAGAPVYRNTEVSFFPLGEDKFEEMKKQLETAEKFIFMEYFIVEEGKMWDSLLEILARKAKQGVEVRFMYDGMCSIMLLPYSYPKKLKALGIQCKMFAPIKPMLSTHQNNRDHRKILVIDGHTAFTGGVNLADEYINARTRFGHWKDTAVMLKGDAVRSFTLMFLEMWNIDERKPESYERYLLPLLTQKKEGLGFVCGYGDSPFDGEGIGEEVYLELLHTAKKYVHIMTPYLILDNAMIRALTCAAKAGVEVIIIMPHIPDKQYAYLLARTYYAELLAAGVQIYEYTPGFVHAKIFVSDDTRATVGTINLDFRSLYLHFECAALMIDNPVVPAIEQDYQNTLKKCIKMTLEDCKTYGTWKKLAGKFLRILAPLM